MLDPVNIVTNISVRRLGNVALRDPRTSIPVWGSPILLIHDTRLKSSYLWVHELIQHVQVHGACDCRFTKKEWPMILSFISSVSTAVVRNLLNQNLIDLASGATPPYTRL